MCVLGDPMSLVLGTTSSFFIVWCCVCVLSVCESCVRFCGDVLVVLFLLRVSCVWVSINNFTAKKNHDETKTRKRQNH